MARFWKSIGFFALALCALLSAALAGTATQATPQVNPTLSLRDNLAQIGIDVVDMVAVEYWSFWRIGDFRVYEFAAIEFLDDDAAQRAIEIVLYYDRRPVDGHWNTSPVTIGTIGNESSALVFSPDSGSQFEGKIVARDDSILFVGRASVGDVSMNPIAFLFPYVQSMTGSPRDSDLASVLPTYEMFDGRISQIQGAGPDRSLISELPTATPSPTASPTATSIPTPRPTSTPRPTPTSTPIPTATPLPTATPSPTATPTPSLTESDDGFRLSGRNGHRITIAVSSGVYKISFRCGSGTAAVEMSGDAIQRTMNGAQTIRAGHPEVLEFDDGELLISIVCSGAWSLTAALET